MQTYVSLVKFTQHGVQTMKEKGIERAETVKQNAKALGGKLLQAYYCLGAYDVVAIWEFPDNETAMKAAVMNASLGTSRSRPCRPSAGTSGRHSCKVPSDNSGKQTEPRVQPSPLTIGPIEFQLSLLELCVQMVKVPALGRIARNDDERLCTETARGEFGRNLLGLLRSRHLDHGQDPFAGPHKGKGGGMIIVHERSQFLLKRERQRLGMCDEEFRTHQTVLDERPPRDKMHRVPAPITHPVTARYTTGEKLICSKALRCDDGTAALALHLVTAPRMRASVSLY